MRFRRLRVLSPLGWLSRKVLRLEAANLRQPSSAGVRVEASLAGQDASMGGPENLADGDGGGASVPPELQDDTGSAADGFLVENDDELDLDCPSEGFSSIPEAIEDIRRGKVSLCPLVVDSWPVEELGCSLGTTVSCPLPQFRCPIPC